MSASVLLEAVEAKGFGGGGMAAPAFGMRRQPASLRAAMTAAWTLVRLVVGFLVRDQPGQVRPHCIEGIEGHHGTGQVQRWQQLSEVAGLVVLDADLEVVKQVNRSFPAAVNAQMAIATRQASG